jgi:tetratricopeptide (TPR) repeat protein
MFHEFESELFEAALLHRPDNLEAIFSLGNAYTRVGRYEDGLAIDERLVAIFPDNPTVRYNLSCSLALLGRIDEALDALHRAIALGFDDERLLATDPDLSGLREDPRFQELLASGNFEA